MSQSENRPPVFDENVDRRPGPATHLETSFQFLNRAEGEFWEQVRVLVQQWLDNVGRDADYRDLRGRLRKDNSISFAAFFELYLHELFRRGGFDVEVHPTIQGSTRHPDFLVTGQGQSVYGEATMQGTPAAIEARGNRKAALLDAIQGSRHQAWFLMLEHIRVGPAPAKGRRVRDLIDKWLDSLDPDADVDLPDRRHFGWSYDGWELVVSAIPVSPSLRGDPDHRIIGVYGDSGAAFVDDAPTIKALLSS
ncbi:MAG TPA: hypothetical protein P5074_15565, partial [Candidatus Nanopelagicales bacterium]|nr:hypothetical protein [Candidatus Nanopelagicales bacterium]